jgi:MSHA pilin protein MshA
MKTTGLLQARHRHTPRHLRASPGMTLLDTLVTISVVGSVSAVALPKLNSMPHEARIAVVEHMAGAVRSAAHLVHMKCAVQTGCDLHAGAGSVTVSGDEVSLLHGYPIAGRAEGIANAMEYVGFTAQQQAAQTWFSKDGAPEPSACGVRYEAGAAPSESPQVTVITSGC